jgi:valyl-tRNA synthetase
VQTEPRADLPKSYEPAAVEARVYRAWLDAGVFHEEPDPARPPFIVSMPPPNITGRAHLGHASTYTAMDILTRYHRMLGENADWLPGQDHAAIATEAVLVREIAKEGLTREGLGREKFLERAWAWREQYGDAIYESFRTLGFGPDWGARPLHDGSWPLGRGRARVRGTLPRRRDLSRHPARELGSRLAVDALGRRGGR